MELAALCFLVLWEATGKDLSRNPASSFSVTNFPLRRAEFDVQTCATDIWKYLEVRLHFPEIMRSHNKTWQGPPALRTQGPNKGHAWTGRAPKSWHVQEARPLLSQCYNHRRRLCRPFGNPNNTALYLDLSIISQNSSNRDNSPYAKLSLFLVQTSVTSDEKSKPKK